MIFDVTLSQHYSTMNKLQNNSKKLAVVLFKMTPAFIYVTPVWGKTPSWPWGKTPTVYPHLSPCKLSLLLLFVIFLAQLPQKLLVIKVLHIRKSKNTVFFMLWKFRALSRPVLFILTITTIQMGNFAFGNTWGKTPTSVGVLPPGWGKTPTLNFFFKRYCSPEKTVIPPITLCVDRPSSRAWSCKVSVFCSASCSNYTCSKLG